MVARGAVPGGGVLADGTWSDDLIAEVSGRVKSIDRELEWEFARGTRGGHAFVVSAAGEPRLRAVAERWRRAAPAADERWEYHSTRQPDPSSLAAALTVSGHEIKLTELGFACRIDADRYEVDVLVHHPDPSLSQTEPNTVAFLALDWLLGEVAVELWVGVVEVTETLPPQAEPGEALIAVVAQLARRLREIGCGCCSNVPRSAVGRSSRRCGTRSSRSAGRSSTPTSRWWCRTGRQRRPGCRPGRRSPRWTGWRSGSRTPPGARCWSPTRRPPAAGPSTCTPRRACRWSRRCGRPSRAGIRGGYG